MPLFVTTRQNGTIMVKAIMLLSRLNLTLFDRLMLSFQRIRLAMSDGNISMIRLRMHMMTSSEISVAASHTGEPADVISDIGAGDDGSIRLPCANALSTGGIMSVTSLGFVTHILQEGCHSVAEISLNGYFSIFCTSSDAAFDFECAA